MPKDELTEPRTDTKLMFRKANSEILPLNLKLSRLASVSLGTHKSPVKSNFRDRMNSVKMKMHLGGLTTLLMENDTDANIISKKLDC